MVLPRTSSRSLLRSFPLRFRCRARPLTFHRPLSASPTFDPEIVAEYIPPRRANMSSSSGTSTPTAAIYDEIKLDLLSINHVEENAAKRKEIARTFICEPFVSLLSSSMLSSDTADTVTVPTEEMYLYATKATLGDDVYHDPSTVALEAHMAKITGKEAALFVPSGTASNQIALRTHLQQPPYSIVVDQRSHINVYVVLSMGA